MVPVVSATRPDDGERVLDALRRLIDGRRTVVAGIDERVDRLAGLLSDFVLDGGKRMRPRFALAGWAERGPDDHHGEKTRVAVLRTGLGLQAAVTALFALVLLAFPGEAAPPSTGRSRPRTATRAGTGTRPATASPRPSSWATSR